MTTLAPGALLAYLTDAARGDMSQAARAGYLHAGPVYGA